MSTRTVFPASEMRVAMIQGDKCINLKDLLLFLHETKGCNDHIIVNQTLDILITYLKEESTTSYVCE